MPTCRRAFALALPLALFAALALGCADAEGQADTSFTTDTDTSFTTDTTAAANATTAGATATSAVTVEDLQQALQDRDLSSLATAINVVGLENLIGSAEYTLFAPNNAAFRRLTANELTELMGEPSELTDVLRNHLVEQKLTATDLQEMTSIETAAGTSLPVTVDGDTVTVGGATVVQADRDVGPGVVHVIDGLLLLA